MAYNPNVPAPDNLVQDDIAAMRGNFQHLAPLAQAVDELQAVSGLASVVEELQAVSGLASVVEELQAVSELAPYIQAILDSRVVEMGSNANGAYVRWENGLQVCWRRFEQVAVDIDITWSFPAEFVAAFPFGIASREGGWLYFYLVGRTSTPLTSAWVFRVVQDRGSSEQWPPPTPPDVYVFAIGRWK